MAKTKRTSNVTARMARIARSWLTQAEAAAVLGVTTRSIVRWESGDVAMLQRQHDRLAHAVKTMEVDAKGDDHAHANI